MKVDLAKSGQRRYGQRIESCDNCVGLELDGQPVPISTQPSESVKRWNVLISGLGTQQFWLHEACAESLR